MRTSLVALAIALAASGCTLGICARNSECPTGQVCSAAGTCAIPADASIDGGDAGSTPTSDAPPDVAPDATTSGGGGP